jgi:hypothetical protein
VAQKEFCIGMISARDIKHYQGYLTQDLMKQKAHTDIYKRFLGNHLQFIIQQTS